MNRNELFALLILSVSVGAGLLLFPATITVFNPDIPLSITGEMQTLALEEYVPEVTEATTTLFVVGDVMLARHVEFLMTRHGVSYPYAQLGFLTEEPAYVLGNFEAAMPKVHKKTPNFGFAFSVQDIFLPAMKEAGFTHVSLANNHAYDYGVSGYQNAKNELVAVGITPFGHPSEVLGSTSVKILEFGDKKIGILALHTLEQRPEREDLESVIDALQAVSDFQIVYIHWGNEYVSLPAEVDRGLAATLSELGVDLIMGHHPHVVQSIERIGETTVFYSLGNFIFDQYFSLEVQEGLVLKLVASSVGVEVQLVPVSSLQTPAQPRLMGSKEKIAFLKKLAAISDAELRESILDGNIAIPWPLATSKETAMMSQ